MAVAFNFERAICGSHSEEGQIDQEKLAAVLQLVVATGRDEVADGDGRHGLKRGLCRRIEEIGRGIIVDYEVQIDV
jgi:hypothetical protein